MRISICIPQFNRAGILIESLRRISCQTYKDIEIIISDDKSTDDTVEQITALQKTYKYPIVLSVSEQNLGYDRNYRRSIELSSGDYAFILGNDDTLNDPMDIQNLVTFLLENNYPDIGYCNYIEEGMDQGPVVRAVETRVQGSGLEVAMKYYNGFSFVAGIIYKRKAFEKFNTDKHDGSIYAQMYLGLLMIASGCKFFTIASPMVIKDIGDIAGKKAIETYKTRLPKSWSEYRVNDGGLISVSHVLISAMEDATQLKDKSVAYRILKRIYGITYPYWIVQYKKYGSLAAAMGLIRGLYPPVTKNWIKIDTTGKIKLMAIYSIMSVAGILFPAILFEKAENRLRQLVRKP